MMQGCQDAGGKRSIGTQKVLNITPMIKEMSQSLMMEEKMDGNLT